MAKDEPALIGEGVWWVGTRLENDQFQCHAYFIDNGAESVLLDPGSPLTIAATLDKVAQIADVEAIGYLVCHHPDPDIAASLRDLSDLLTREDVQAVTEWRAQALLKHYGHRFGYYLVEEHGWRVPLGPGRDLEFQLTPYLHFPGAMVSYDTRSATLFSSDLFGGFVPDSDVLVSHDLDYIIDAARPFHQHYMPSTELLTAGLIRIQQRWPHIARIAPQHGHIIPGEIVDAAFTALKGIDCGVFTLADADIDLKRLLRISEAKVRITEALLTAAEPASLVAAMNTILAATDEASDCALFIDVPEQGWTMWGKGLAKPLRRDPDARWPTVDLLGPPAALLSLRTMDDVPPDEDLMRMLADMASTVRPAIDEYLDHLVQSQQSAAYLEASLTDPLTGLGNRRALVNQGPSGDYALISLDLDHFKAVNDTFGHAAGDTVLTRVAHVLTGSVRDGDRVFRLGGEEFLIVLPDAAEAAAIAIAERVRTSVRDIDFTGLAPEGRVTISEGIASAVNAGLAEFHDTLEQADGALYESKETGRDKITVRHAPV
ncbi:MAG: diguanylate cyclase [Actinobacteria bacterium]|nr:diguanylate cyclase [Actinomycetota bacterium]